MNGGPTDVSQSEKSSKNNQAFNFNLDHSHGSDDRSNSRSHKAASKTLMLIQTLC